MDPERRLHLATLTPEQAALLAAVEETHSASNGGSHELNDAQRETADRLVGMGLLFYSMDLDHVASYRLRCP